MIGFGLKRHIIAAVGFATVAAGCLLAYAAGIPAPKAQTDNASLGDRTIKTHANISDPGVPTAAFIAAAMRNQASASIEAKYSLSDWCTFHYVRTPEALSIKRTFLNGSETVEASYDFAARETRLLQTQKDGSVSGIIQTPWLGDPFVMGDLLDPVLYVLPWGAEGPRPLYEWIPSGQVLAERDDIDGHPCWRIDLTQPAERMERYSIWSDPSVGFCPRRIEIVPAGQSGTTVISFQDYRELATGIWFPMKQVSDYPAPRIASKSSTLGSHGPVASAQTNPVMPGGDLLKGTISGLSTTPSEQVAEPLIQERKTQTITASEATASKVFTKSSLMVRFPSGTKVYINNSSIATTIP